MVNQSLNIHKNLRSGECKMLVGLFKSEFPHYQIKRNETYKRILNYNNIDFIEVHIDQSDFWEKVKKVDLFMFPWAHVDDHRQIVNSILPVLENYLSIKCFPNLDTCWHFDDKIKEYYLMNSLGYPMIESWIFWDKKNALDWAERVEYPVVFKLKNGAGSRNVVLITKKKEAIKIINKMFGRGILSSYGIPHRGKVKYKDFENFLRYKADQYFLNKVRGIKPTIWQTEKNYVLFQRFLPNNSFDTRVTVIGNRGFAMRRFVRNNDFRASGSGKWDLDRNNVDLRTVELAMKISRELKFQSMAYDFLYDDKGNPQVCEMSWTYPDDLEQGYWDENLNWHDLQFIPSYFHLKDALNLENFKLPEISILKS